jgi:hypothetical protein
MYIKQYLIILMTMFSVSSFCSANVIGISDKGDECLYNASEDNYIYVKLDGSVIGHDIEIDTPFIDGDTATYDSISTVIYSEYNKGVYLWRMSRKLGDGSFLTEYSIELVVDPSLQVPQRFTVYENNIYKSCTF